MQNTISQTINSQALISSFNNLLITYNNAKGLHPNTPAIIESIYNGVNNASSILLRGRALTYSENSASYMATPIFKIKYENFFTSSGSAINVLKTQGDKYNIVSKINEKINAVIPNLDDMVDSYYEPYGGSLIYLSNLDILKNTKKDIYINVSSSFEPVKSKIYALLKNNDQDFINEYKNALATGTTTNLLLKSIIKDLGKTKKRLNSAKTNFDTFLSILQRDNVHLIDKLDTDVFDMVVKSKRVCLIDDSNYSNLDYEKSVDVYKSIEGSAGKDAYRLISQKLKVYQSILDNKGVVIATNNVNTPNLSFLYALEHRANVSVFATTHFSQWSKDIDYGYLSTNRPEYLAIITPKNPVIINNHRVDLSNLKVDKAITNGLYVPKFKRVVKTFECFAGIGSQFKALKNLSKNDKSLKFESVGISEWNISSIIANAIVNHKRAYSMTKPKSREEMLSELSTFTFSKDGKNPYDISKLSLTTLTKLYKANKATKNKGSIVNIQGKNLSKNIDIFTYSYPCQQLSQNGKREGMLKDITKSSGLVWQIIRILKELKELGRLPKTLLLENVPTLTTIFADEFKLVREELEKLGYFNEYKILNSNDFNCVQARRRCYMVSTLTSPVNLTSKAPDNKDLTFNDILEYRVKNNSFVKVSDKLQATFNKTDKTPTSSKNGLVKIYCEFDKFVSTNRVFLLNSKCPTILTSRSALKIVDRKNNLRYLSVKEAFRATGFSDYDYKKVKDELSDAELFKIMGNSIVVSVLESIFNDILNQTDIGTLKLVSKIESKPQTVNSNKLAPISTKSTNNRQHAKTIKVAA